ncbi:MAG: RlmE family RNA methyltransferase [Proteobacteria bacterium]|nr:RlmE family RNA methyltransferase [Pseudomonadota bacterium]MBI3498323.1 RlmE family RNA methyltransferase [Pseudomonadota bacterium]
MTGRTPSGGGPSGGRRRAAERLRTARRHKPSSQRWLARQLNDPYVAEAKRQGWRSRAAFKLIELDQRFHLLKPGQKIVDLGAAPGGWTQVAAQRSKAGEGRGRVVALDVSPMDPVPGARLITLDFLAAAAPERIKAELAGPADVVLSDMAQPTTGHEPTDHLRIIALAEAALAFALEVLAPGGSFVCKLFQGGAERAMLVTLKRHFARVRHAKPPASRKESAETYLVAQGFRSKP